MLRSILKYTLIVSLTALLFSCVEAEDFPTPQGARLSFSKDSLDLDTVIIGSSAATERFTIYNNNSDGISITEVKLSDNKHFFINVDGTFIDGNLPSSIDCRNDDSLIVFLQYTAPQQIDSPFQEHETDIIFTLANGISQSVHAKATALNAIILRDDTIKENTIFNDSLPYAIYKGITVAEGVTLELQEGTTMFFNADAGLKVHGCLKAHGSLEKPITMRGNRLDNMFDKEAYDRVPNQWQGITFTSSSYDNTLSYCDIHSGKYGIRCDSSDITKQKLLLENSIIHNTKDHALELYNTRSFIGNCQITNAGGNCINVYGGNNTFVHSTIGSFYIFEGGYGNALFFSNHVGDTLYPIDTLFFYNSIITGYATDEIFGDKYQKHEAIPFNFGFINCLLNTPEFESDEDGTVINCLWDNKKNKVCREANFKKFDTEYLYFDFSLDSLSVAIGNADTEITNKYYPSDRLGTDRLNDGTSDIGCYEYKTDKAKAKAKAKTKANAKAKANAKTKANANTKAKAKAKQC